MRTLELFAGIGGSNGSTTASTSTGPGVASASATTSPQRRGSSTRKPVAPQARANAAKSKSFDALVALLENPATDVNVFNQARESALMFACLFGQLDTVKRLIGRGAEVNHPGWTPLHYAASTGQVAVIEYLLGQYAYIDAASENGTTPLMMAARDRQLDAVRLLVREGADPSLRNEAGLGAADYLQRAGATEESRWMQARADEYLARYGTKADPVPAKSR